jgi:hypothetical protein
MSNQAREIMGQVLDEKFRGTWTCLNYQDLVVFSEKYMELVVRECLTIVETECDDTPDDGGFHMGEFCGSLMYTIEEHFGVGEE